MSEEEPSQLQIIDQPEEDWTRTGEVVDLKEEWERVKQHPQFVKMYGMAKKLSFELADPSARPEITDQEPIEQSMLAANFLTTDVMAILDGAPKVLDREHPEREGFIDNALTALHLMGYSPEEIREALKSLEE